MNKQLNYKREKNRERFAHMQMKEIWEEQVETRKCHSYLNLKTKKKEREWGQWIMKNELALNDERWESQRGNETRNEVKDYTAGNCSKLRSVKSQSQKTFLPNFLTLFFLCFFVCVSIWCVGGKFHSLFPLSFHAFSLWVCVRVCTLTFWTKRFFCLISGPLWLRSL